MIHSFFVVPEVSGDEPALAAAGELNTFLVPQGLVELGKHKGQNPLGRKQLTLKCFLLQTQEVAHFEVKQLLS